MKKLLSVGAVLVALFISVLPATLFVFMWKLMSPLGFAERFLTIMLGLFFVLPWQVFAIVGVVLAVAYMLDVFKC